MRPRHGQPTLGAHLCPSGWPSAAAATGQPRQYTCRSASEQPGQNTGDAIGQPSACSWKCYLRRLYRKSEAKRACREILATSSTEPVGFKEPTRCPDPNNPGGDMRLPSSGQPPTEQHQQKNISNPAANCHRMRRPSRRAGRCLCTKATMPKKPACACLLCGLRSRNDRELKSPVVSVFILSGQPLPPPAVHPHVTPKTRYLCRAQKCSHASCCGRGCVLRWAQRG